MEAKTDVQLEKKNNDVLANLSLAFGVGSLFVGGTSFLVGSI
jgi:hypothetical protein